MPSRSVQLAQLVLVGHRARRRGRAEERAAEARALLVGPVDEPHRERRRALLGDPPQHLDAGHDVQAAVEPAAVRHRVDVAADQQRALGGAAEREPLVAGLVDLLLDGAGRRACRAATPAPAPTSPSRRRAGRRSRRPVSSRSSRSSATVRVGSSGTRRAYSRSARVVITRRGPRPAPSRSDAPWPLRSCARRRDHVLSSRRSGASGRATAGSGWRPAGRGRSPSTT